MAHQDADDQWVIHADEPNEDAGDEHGGPDADIVFGFEPDPVPAPPANPPAGNGR